MTECGAGAAGPCETELGFAAEAGLGDGVEFGSGVEVEAEFGSEVEIELVVLSVVLPEMMLEPGDTEAALRGAGPGIVLGFESVGGPQFLLETEAGFEFAAEVLSAGTEPGSGGESEPESGCVASAEPVCTFGPGAEAAWVWWGTPQRRRVTPSHEPALLRWPVAAAVWISQQWAGLVLEGEESGVAEAKE